MTEHLRSVCWICYRAAAPTLKGILRHMASVHAHDPRFHVVCGVEGCSRTYCNFYSFKRHMYRKHRGNLDLPGPVAVENSEDNELLVNHFGSDDNHNDCAGADPELSEFQHKKEIALFLLKAKEVRKLSQTALDGIIFDFTELHQQIINLLKVQAKSCLEGNGLSMDSICGFEEVFDNPDSCTPFRQLDSKSLQETFYRDHLNLLVSIRACMAKSCINNNFISVIVYNTINERNLIKF